MASVTIDTTLFHAGQFLGSGYIYQSLKDWASLPDSKAESSPIAQGPGRYDGGEDWPDAWVGSLKGYIRGATRVDALRMRAQLNTIRKVESLSRITVDDEDGPTSRLVSIRRVTIGDIRNQRVVDFAIDMQADDPYRYGPEVAVSNTLPVGGSGFVWPADWDPGADWGSGGNDGRVVTVNTGTQSTYSRFTVSGGLAGGFSLISVEDGRELRFERPVPLGSIVTVDPRTGRVWIDDEANNVRKYLVRADWWSVPAGGFRTVQFNAIGDVTGTPTLTAYTAPPFL